MGNRLEKVNSTGDYNNIASTDEDRLRNNSEHFAHLCPFQSDLLTQQVIQSARW